MKYLIIDHSIGVFLENRILDPEFAARYPGASVYTSLARQAKSHGWEIITADVFLKTISTFEQAVCLSNEFTPFLPELIQRGVTPGLLISGESPNVARQFYHELPQRSKPFRHACLFEGSLSRVDKNTQTHPFLWPCPDAIIHGGKTFEDRKLLCMVAGYKYSFFWKSLFFPKKVIAEIKWKILQLKNPSLRFKDLYNLRMRLARLFGSLQEFYLFGSGWEEEISRESLFSKWQFVNRPYPCQDKLRTMADFRFSLVLENCVYPGYVTEKIFDAFRAGTVPVYYGAPDIASFVPKECFIDYREYKNPDRLWYRISTMSEGEWMLFKTNIDTFLISEKYKTFLEENVAIQWVNWLEES